MRAGPVAIVAAALPYAAVVAGLVAARSAWAAILLYHAGIVVLLAASGPRKKIRRVAGGWRTVAALTGAGAGGGAGVLLYVLWPYIAATGAGLETRLVDFGLGGRSWVVFAVYYATVHPVLEELHWRAGDTGTTRWPSGRDAAFAGYHAVVLPYFIAPFWVAVAFGVLLATAWIWRAAARRFDGLAVPLLSHIVADTGIVIAATAIAHA
jgi:hypothetical protein